MAQVGAPHKYATLVGSEELSTGVVKMEHSGAKKRVGRHAQQADIRRRNSCVWCSADDRTRDAATLTESRLSKWSPDWTNWNWSKKRKNNARELDRV